MKQISFQIPDDLLQELDKVLEGESRSAFIRSILRDKLYSIQIEKTIKAKQLERIMKRDEEIKSGATFELIDMKLTPRKPNDWR